VSGGCSSRGLVDKQTSALWLSPSPPGTCRSLRQLGSPRACRSRQLASMVIGSVGPRHSLRRLSIIAFRGHVTAPTGCESQPLAPLPRPPLSDGGGGGYCLSRRLSRENTQQAPSRCEADRRARPRDSMQASCVVTIIMRLASRCMHTCRLTSYPRATGRLTRGLRAPDS
jgi:hypothetical protein